MSNWADAPQDDFYDPHGSDIEESEDEIDSEAAWANATIEKTIEVEPNGDRYEVQKKVRRYLEDRYVTPADIRAHLPHFGKGLGDQNTLVSSEPPLALEMGSVDQYDRESRTEVKRLIHEASSMNVVVKDAHLRVIRELEEAKKKEASKATSSQNTWGGAVASREKPRDMATNGIRIRNVSDDITDENLSRIFSGKGWRVTSVRLPRGENSQSRGFAFVFFSESWMADAAIKEGRFLYKNVVLEVSRAASKT